MRREREEAPEVELDGSYESYVRYAMAKSPELRGDFERWRAATLRIRPARTLPEPVLTYGAFLRTPETRVGPQRQRVGLRQMFPWPTRLTHAASSAAHSADSAGRRFDARAVIIRRRVAEAYWNVWFIHRAKVVDREEREIIRALEQTLRARIEVGASDLAQLSQIDLRLSRLDDRIDALDETEHQLAARLLGVIGAPSGDETPVSDTPPVIEPPAESLRALLAAAIDHPRARAMIAMAEASDERALSERARRMPSFTLGVDWIETGAARMDGVSDSGKDPLALGLGVTLPIWVGSYRDREEGAHAEAEASRADADAIGLANQAEVRASLAGLRDSARRVRLYRHTLIPQARANYESVLGAYQAGRSSVADLLLADRDLLELSLGAARASADHAIAWAELESATGRPVSARGHAPQTDQPPPPPAASPASPDATVPENTPVPADTTPATAGEPTR
ncbi:MAG: TolC family protein [Deltaproteobacteria bacterium]|nr:TolC family protein [Deltaproteobacteria bacterium]